MIELYKFNTCEKSSIEFLKKIVVIKYGNYKTFQLKKEKLDFYTSVVLYAPKLYNINTIEAYLLKNANAIYKLCYKCNFTKINIMENMEYCILFLGKVYKIVFDNTLSKNYILEEEKCIIYINDSENILNIKLKLYKEQAIKILTQRLYLYADKFNLPVKKIKIRNYKSLWGACYSDRTILLNQRLILAPKETIDAIVCHELAHILQPNHSKDFYKTLEIMYPSYYKDHIWLNLFMPSNFV